MTRPPDFHKESAVIYGKRAKPTTTDWKMLEKSFKKATIWVVTCCFKFSRPCELWQRWNSQLILGILFPISSFSTQWCHLCSFGMTKHSVQQSPKNCQVLTMIFAHCVYVCIVNPVNGKLLIFYKSHFYLLLNWVMTGLLNLVYTAWGLFQEPHEQKYGQYNYCYLIEMHLDKSLFVSTVEEEAILVGAYYWHMHQLTTGS